MLSILFHKEKETNINQILCTCNSQILLNLYVIPWKFLDIDLSLKKVLIWIWRQKSHLVYKIHMIVHAYL